MFRKILLYAFLSLITLKANAVFIPVPVTGYTADVVANGAGPALGSITADFDGANYALMDATFSPATGVFPTQFLPAGGIINSANTAGVVYNLASYSSNNSLRITSLNTDSLVFVTPSGATAVYVLGATGSGGSTVNMQVNFTDGSNQLFSSLSVPDWYSGASYAILGLGRTNVTTTAGGIDNNTINPRLYETILTLSAANTSKLIRSVTFTRTVTAAGVLNIMGISISSPATPSCIATPVAPTNGGSICAGTTTLSWSAATGATGYDVYLNSGATATTIVSTNQAGTTFTTAALTAGPYAWKVIPKNSNGAATGCATFTFTVNATVTPSVTIAASPTGTICAGTPVTFTATPANGGTTPAYQWKKGATNVGTNSATYTDNALANGDPITVVLTSNAACPSPATATSTAITMAVLPRPDTAVTVTGTTAFCTGGSVVFSTSGASGLTYQWLLNNAVIGSATNSSYTANAAGDYRVVVSNGTCSDTSVARTVTVNPIPTATVTPAGPLTICSNTRTTLTAAATTGTYQWQKGGVDIVGATNATYSANAAGSYTVVVTSLGCTATSNAVTISVNPTPGATATAGGPLAFCQGGSVTLTGSSSLSSGATYQWLRAGLVVAGAINPTYVATTSGAYTVRIVNTATGCADTSSPAITVTVSTPPSTATTLTGTLTFCQGSNVRITSSNPATYTFQWYKDGLPIAGAIANSYLATAAGVYYVTIVNGTCSAISTTRTVVVNPLPTVAIVANGPTAFCAGGSVVLDGGSTSGLTYQWRLNAVNIAGATAASYTANQSGSYTLVVTNSNGCTATSNAIAVTVSAPPVPVITSTGATTFCQGNSITLEATVGTGYTYQWLLNGTPVPGATGATYGAAASGSYTVIITNGTCVATSAPFAVNVLPAPPAVITPAGPTAFCQGGSVTMNANRASGLTYQWTRNTVDIPGATSYQYTATVGGSYTVKISDGTCPATSAAVAVTVGEFPVAVITVTGGVDMSTDIYSAYQWYRNGVAIPGATSQNYTAVQDGFYAVVVTDGLGCSATSSVVRITALDVTGVNGSTVRVYPNPTDGMVMVAADVTTDLMVMGVDGKVLATAQAAKSIDISALPQGLYMIRITNHNNGQLISLQKIVRK